MIAETARISTASGDWFAETACDRWPGSDEFSSLALTPDGAVHIIHHGLDGTLLHTFLDPGPHPPCFIATAAFGSELFPRIEVLRPFRDGYLSSHPAGRKVVDAYHGYGCPAADLVAERPRLRALVRTLLFPVIGLVSLLV